MVQIPADKIDTWGTRRGSEEEGPMSYRIEGGEMGHGVGDKIPGSAGDLRDAGRGAEDCAGGSGTAPGGVRQYRDPRGGIVLYVGREAGEQQRVSADHEDE